MTVQPTSCAVTCVRLEPPNMLPPFSSQINQGLRNVIDTNLRLIIFWIVPLELRLMPKRVLFHLLCRYLNPWQKANVLITTNTITTRALIVNIVAVLFLTSTSFSTDNKCFNSSSQRSTKSLSRATKNDIKCFNATPQPQLDDRLKLYLACLTLFLSESS